ncbi:substrate-binding domain-containing protein [Paenalcaligenes niemegkensis]|uniref:substrate-binding domain-containing protein n=1 Tax=Paenalcaligenes niemegkensis TaxID=2895469 RepID=UPI001EE7902F|nr:substrate-binding domain-containing protein [Paenalcaligenes niemegkensis]MCQ9617548.1 substrate-binding domain-containing protein [Paenalcaligenes niemegkensis]
MSTLLSGLKKLSLATFAVGMMLQGGTAMAQDSDRLMGIVEPLVATKPLTIGLSVVHLNDDFWRGITYGIQDEAKRSNVKLERVFVAGAYGNVREQFAHLSTFKTLGVDVAVLGASAFNGFDPAIRDLQRAGINVMAVGIPVNSPNISLGVTQDDAGIGQQLAEVLCEADDKAQVLALPGPAGAEWARLRHEAFKETLSQKCPGTKVTDASFSSGLTLQNGLTQASDLLLRQSEINAIFTPQVSLGMGAAQAARQMNRDVKVLTSALVPEVLPLIKRGQIYASVSEPGILMGRLIVQYAIRQAEDKPLPNVQNDDYLPYPYVLTPTTPILESNVDTFPVYDTDLPPADWDASAIMR